MGKIHLYPERCNGCKACEFACAVAHHEEQNPYLTLAGQSMPRPFIQVEAVGNSFLPLVCRHCEEAPCVAACMGGALHYNEQGLVIRNAEQCVGCWMCVMACPFGAIRPDFIAQRSQKCQGCADMAEPPCVTACEPKALVNHPPAEFEPKEG